MLNQIAITLFDFLVRDDGAFDFFEFLQDVFVVLHDLADVDEVVTKLQNIANSTGAVITKNKLFDLINGGAVLIEYAVGGLD